MMIRFERTKNASLNGSFFLSRIKISRYHTDTENLLWFQENFSAHLNKNITFKTVKRKMSHIAASMQKIWSDNNGIYHYIIQEFGATKVLHSIVGLSL